MTEINTRIYQALAIRQAARFYIKTKMKVNKSYTPRNMKRAAEHITGKPCPDLPSVIENLTFWVEETRNGTFVQG